MAAGGGTFLTQNKKLPGAYINFVSAQAVSQALSDRGIVAFATNLDWGPEHVVMNVTNTDFQRDCMKIFGYPATSPKMKGLADLFQNAIRGYIFRLNPPTGTKAAIEYITDDSETILVGTARYTGARGNDISVRIELNIDSPDTPTPEEPALYDVTTYVGDTVVDSQTKITAMSQIIDKEFVVWNKAGTIMELIATATGGTTAQSTNADIEDAMAKFEPYQYNIFSTDVVPSASLVAYIKSYVTRVREQTGAKMQAVIYAPTDIGTSVDYEGIISVQNNAIVDATTLKTEDGFSKAAPCFWIAGAEAGCAVNKSLTNAVYNGSFLVNLDFSQDDLVSFIDNGRFVLYRDGDDVRVLTDINGLTTYTLEKNADFSNNQTIRVLDQIAIETGILFSETFLGKVPNDEDGRISFKDQLADIFNQLQDLRAIQNFDYDEDISVWKGITKTSVVVDTAVEPTNVMEKLYMTVRVG
ncbi:phage tail sheath subtilisin-like domain-containing protein [Methanolapillus millepedarum]|uniref:Phage tail protein n=1 Tax=Methanolapillus millepedarum TaxID=3028296 RepID=A0AA96VDC4_9EURY|nr:hypothetical protein MsAc7_17640 [Methanosarcinaceae archaeon Ac7]